MKNNIPYHQSFNENLQGKDYFIGDIHGEYNELLLILKKIQFDFKRDRLFSVGDLIDRGADSFKVLRLASEKWFFPVVGNHEEFLLNYDIENKYLCNIWEMNGGSWWGLLTKSEQAYARLIIENHYAYTITVPVGDIKIGVLHAEYHHDFWPLTLEKEINDECFFKKLLWGRDIIAGNQSKIIKNIDYLVSGHTPLPEVRILGNQIFIDTGAGHFPSNKINNPRLTICEYSMGRFISYSLKRAELQVDFNDINRL